MIAAGKKPKRVTDAIGLTHYEYRGYRIGKKSMGSRFGSLWACTHDDFGTWTDAWGTEHRTQLTSATLAGLAQAIDARLAQVAGK
jgi:hypothetical protein